MTNKASTYKVTPAITNRKCALQPSDSINTSNMQPIHGINLQCTDSKAVGDGRLYPRICNKATRAIPSSQIIR